MKKMSHRNPTEVVVIRSAGVAVCALCIGIAVGYSLPSLRDALLLMAVGAVTCGCAMLFLLYAQRQLGAAKAGAVFAIYPLIGAIVSILLFHEMPTIAFIAALFLILPGLFFAITKNSDTNLRRG